MSHGPGEFHNYYIVCEDCGERGYVRLTIDPERAPERPVANPEPRPTAVDGPQPEVRSDRAGAGG